MKIAPLDLRRARFGSSVRGFNRTEVVSFLNEAADGYEQALRDAARLRREVDTLQHRLEEHRRREATLRDTRLTAQRVSAEARESAKPEVAASIEGSIVALRHALESVKQHDRDRLQDDTRRQHQPGSDTRLTGTERPAPRPVITTDESRPSA